MLSFECIKNEKSVYFLLTSANILEFLRNATVLWVLWECVRKSL